MRKEYWEERQGLKYYKRVKEILEGLPGDSILDVGSGGTPVATWGDFKERAALNLTPCTEWPGVESITGDWFDYVAPTVFDVITCLQVLEHFSWPDAMRFARKVLNSCRVAVFSVPYKWKAGVCKHHKIDPVIFRDIVELSHRSEWRSFEIVEDSGVKRAIWVCKGFAV